MDRESVERLKFDRRLRRRRGWVAPEDVQSHLDALPDVAEKMTTVAELEAEEETAAPGAGGSAEAGASSGGLRAGLAGSGSGPDPGGRRLS